MPDLPTKLQSQPAQPLNKALVIAFLVVSIFGFLDATYLTVEHFRGIPPPCNILKGCEEVTTSSYSTILGIPVALGGALYYLVVLVLSILYFERGRQIRFIKYAARLTLLGFLASLYFLFLQIFVIKAICIYCLFSALTSTTLLVLACFIQQKIHPKSI